MARFIDLSQVGMPLLTMTSSGFSGATPSYPAREDEALFNRGAVVPRTRALRSLRRAFTTEADSTVNRSPSDARRLR